MLPTWWAKHNAYGAECVSRTGVKARGCVGGRFSHSLILRGGNARHGPRVLAYVIHAYIHQCDGSTKLSVTSKVFRVFVFAQLNDWGNQSIEETRRTTVDTCHVSTYILKYDVARPRTIKSK